MKNRKKNPKVVVPIRGGEILLDAETAISFRYTPQIYAGLVLRVFDRAPRPKRGCKFRE